MENTSIHKIVQDLENKYVYTPSQISQFVDYSQYENINRIEAYINDKHTSGDKDALGRDKPFYNITTSARNIWYRATKRRLNDIKIRADKEGNVLASSLATILLSDWFKKTYFETFLTKWGMTLATYGSAITKFIDKGSELDYSVVKWNTVISDNLDFYNNPIIEKFYMSPGELATKKGYDKDQVNELLENLTIRKNLNKTNVDTKADFVELYEVHGIFPLSMITGKEKDDDNYVHQMHVISYVGSDSTNDYKEFTLVKGREDKCPYILTNLLPDPTGQRAMGKGAVELLFNTQWMTNHSQKLIKDQLDLASKLIYQTADESFIGRNATSEIENGDILVHAANMPLTQVNNNSHDITSLQNLSMDWKNLSTDISSTPDAMRGGDIKSGTAYRTQQLAVNESSSLFDEMSYNKDIALKEMLREFIIPYVKRKMDSTEEVSAILDSNDIKKIDAKFVKNTVNREVNQKLIDQVFEAAQNPKAQMPTPEEQAQLTQEGEQSMQSQLSELGNQRFFKPSDLDSVTWKESINDFEWEVIIDTPSDQKDVNLVMETLTNVLNTITDPTRAAALNTPMGKMLFNKIISMTGAISPLEIADIQATQDIATQQQTMQAQQQLSPEQNPQMAT